MRSSVPSEIMYVCDRCMRTGFGWYATGPLGWSKVRSIDLCDKCVVELVEFLKPIKEPTENWYRLRAT